jgi:outer membrane protein assembly factor BamB
MRLSIIGFVFLSLHVTLLAQENTNANWPQFRGERAAGLASGAATPHEWDVASGKNVRWKTPIPGLAHSSPVIWGDRVYLTTAEIPGQSQSLKVGLYGDVNPVNENTPVDWRVLCLDKSTGKILWDKTAYTGVPKIKRHPKASHANSTPAVDDKRLVAFFGSEGLYCYDLDGNQIWKRDLGVLDSGFFRMPGAQWGFASSPVLYQDKVIVQCDVQKGSFVAALDAATGNELWRTPREEVPTWSTPAIIEPQPGATGPNSGVTQVVCNGWKQIAGYDLADGKLLWSMKGGGDIPVPTPIAASGMVFITNAHGPGSPVYAINLATARGDISLASGQTSNEHVAWSVPRGGNYMQTPIVVGDLLFSCMDTGQLTCRDAKTGKQLYRERLSEERKGFTASPVASADKLYFPAEDGVVYVIAATPEFKKLAENPLGEECMATPAVSDGTIYFRTRGHLIAFGSK